MHEAVIFEEVDESGLRSVRGYISNIVLVGLREPEHFFQQKLAQFHATLFGPNLEGTNLQNLVGLDGSVRFRPSFVLPNDQASKPVIEDCPAIAPFSHALLTPPCIERRIILPQAIENLVSQLDLVGGHLLDIAYRCLDWLIRCPQQRNSVGDKQNTPTQLGRSPTRAFVETTILCDEEVGCTTLDRIKERGIDNVIRPRQRAEFPL